MDPSGTFWHNGMRVNATLRRLEWQLYDTAVIEVAVRKLVGVQDLISAGLTYNVPDALGVTQIVWEQISRMDPAQITMSGISQTPNDRQEFTLLTLPLPIIHKDFNINIRALHTSRRIGTPLDVSQAQLSARLVSEAIETLLFAGTTVLGTNNAVYGYTTLPQRATGTTNAAWSAAWSIGGSPGTDSGPLILNDVLSMVNASINNNYYGPWMMYVPAPVFTNLGNDFKTYSDRSALERILAVPGIIGVQPSKDLTGKSVVLVQMDRDVVDMVDGMQPTTLEWEEMGGMIVNFKVMAIMAPRVKYDYANQSGVVHYS